MAVLPYIFTDNGVTDSEQCKWDRGAYQILAKGDFGGGTLAYQVSSDNINFIDDRDSLLTFPDTYIVDIEHEVHWRMSLTGATNPNLKVYVHYNVGEI